MRLPVTIAAIALVAVPASAKAPGAPLVGGANPFKCNNNLLHYADKNGEADAKRLGELPPGDLHLTVVREVDGCREPVIVRYGVGVGEREAPAPRAPFRMQPRPRLIR